MWEAVVGVAAAIAVVISLISLIRSIRGEREAKATRRGMVRVQEQMADALGRIAEAQEAMGPLVQESDLAPGGTPSVRLVPSGASGSEHLEITNRGPGSIEIIDLQVLGQPEIVVRGGGDVRGTELLPEEETNVMVAITFGTNLPLEVLTKWRDAEGVHDRVQKINYS